MRSRPLVTAGVALIAAGVVLAGFGLAGTTPGGGAGGGGTSSPSAAGATASTSSSGSAGGASASSGQTSSAQAVGSRSTVSWIALPSLGIRTQLSPDGLSANGTISPPAGHVIWFTGYDRVMPGRLGTAVVAGHIVANGRPDVFNRLPDLRTGATVDVGYANGTVLTLKVVHTAVLAKSALQHDSQVWGSNTTTRRVALITCDNALGFRSDGHRVANFVAIAEPA